MVSSLRPTSLEEALQYRQATQALPFSGGTDLMVKRRGYSGTGPRFEETLLFLDAVESLKHIAIEGNELHIGAAVTLAELLNFASLPKLLKHAIAEIAAPGLRNRATLAGNIANASPAGDSLPPLYVHNAVLILMSVHGERRIPIGEFLLGPGSTVLADNEIIGAIRIPILEEGLTYYRKIGTRKANALSKLSAAGYARKHQGALIDVRFALGAVASTVLRLGDTEALIMQDAVEERILESARDIIRPIDDQRSTARYRKQVALNILREFLHQVRKATSSNATDAMRLPTNA